MFLARMHHGSDSLNIKKGERNKIFKPLRKSSACTPITLETITKLNIDF